MSLSPKEAETITRMIKTAYREGYADAWHTIGSWEIDRKNSDLPSRIEAAYAESIANKMAELLSQIGNT